MQAAGSVPLTELRFEGDFSQKKEPLEEDFLIKYNFLGKNRQQEQFNHFLMQHARREKHDQYKKV